MMKRFWLALCAVCLSVGPAMAQDSEGFTQLFNGKDLTGWKTHPDDKAVWKVEDGMIVGSGPAGHLFTERDDYTDFVYRLHVKISDKGNSGQYFRTKFKKAFPVSGVDGYEAQINSTGGDKVKTGSLYSLGPIVTDILVPPDTWFVQEVTAKGKHITIKVNDKVTVDRDIDNPKQLFLKGHFAIQQHDPGSKVWIKKVEVKELK
ncbi:MAG: DUF1080 domain-containing protein [Gemmataceae bacterium]